MMLTFLNSYLTLNLLLVLGFGLFQIFKNLSSRERLKLQYITLGLMFLTILSQPFIPKHDYIIPAIKVWEGSASDIGPISIETSSKSFVTLSSEVTASRLDTTILFQLLFSLVALVVLWGLFKMIKELLMLKRIEHASFLIRKKSRIHVFVNDQINVPFSYNRFGKLMTIIPSSMLLDKNDFQASVFHEFQHHRQGDTLWVYILLTLKNICFLNPFSHLIEKEVLETQEFACDEALIEKNRVSTDSYIRCLVKVAQTVVLANSEPECASGFCFSRGHNILKRRIEKMNSQQFVPGKKMVFNVLTLVLVATMALSAWASRNLVQDRKITLQDAQELIKNQDDFPLVVNDDVLTQLNKYLGTPEGRAFIRDSLTRKKEYAAILEEKTRQYGTPDELNAIPVVESGYINRSSTGRVRAAGLWMFIPATARRYGMKVNEKQDERLNVEKETDAALRYLIANKNMFNDWHLSLLAYNVGEGTVKQGIKKFNTRDAWELVAKGVEGDKDYLPSVMAAMIIMKNPSLLEN